MRRKLMIASNDLRARGARHSGSKLTDEAVIEIRRLYFDENQTMTQLAEAYGVSTKTVANVLHGVTWRHVTGRTS
jgi:hypothetical protein